MIIQTHTFQYYKKTFKADEMDVKTYMKYLCDPSETVKQILLKHNKKIPNMSEEQLKNFINILFNVPEEKKSGIKKKPLTEKELIKETEYLLQTVKYQVMLLARNLKQPMSELMNLSMSDFLFAQTELPNVMEPDKFTPFADRNKINKRALKEFSTKKK